MRMCASMYKNRRMKECERKKERLIGSYQGWLWSKEAIYLKCN